MQSRDNDLQIEISLNVCLLGVPVTLGCRTVTMKSPLLLTSGSVRYEAVLHRCGTMCHNVTLCTTYHTFTQLLFILLDSISLEGWLIGYSICVPPVLQQVVGVITSIKKGGKKSKTYKYNTSQYISSCF